MAVKKGLGRGLNSLIPTGDEEIKQPAKSENIKEEPKETTLKLSQIEPNKEQPRKNFEEDAIQELSDSIKQYGIIQPLVVKKRKDYYELIAGERRYRAARMAGLKEVPVIIKDYNDQEILEISLIENIQRENLNPIEEAQAYKRLIDEFHLKQDEVAERVSKNRTTITNSMRLLKLSEKVQDMLVEDMLSTGHARALLAIEDKNLQYEIAYKVFDNKLSVRETEKLVKATLTKKEEKEKESKPDLSFLYQDIEKNLKDIIGSKISIKAADQNKGKIEIAYYSQDELERITEILYSIRQ